MKHISNFHSWLSPFLMTAVMFGPLAVNARAAVILNGSDGFIVGSYGGVATPGTFIVITTTPVVSSNVDPTYDASGGALIVYGGIRSEKDSVFNDVGIGRGKGDIITNTALGNLALFSNTTAGYQNTAAGFGSLYLNTTGNSNTAYGALSLLYNTLGYANTAIGT